MRRGGSRVPLVVALGFAAAGAILTVVSIFVAAAGTGSGRTMRVRGASMEPTYPQGSDVTVRSVGAMPIRRGQVVVFSARDWGANDIFMQRVIGLGGDRVAIGLSGTVSVNGTPLNEPYLRKTGSSLSGIPVDVTVPKGRLFLLGDHRAAAVDSRAHLSENNGTIARSAVTGVVVTHPSNSFPDQSWAWVGAAITTTGLVVAAATAIATRRRADTGIPGTPMW